MAVCLKTSRFRGVSRERPGKFRAQATLDKKKLGLGTFPIDEAAARAYDAFWRARGRIHGLNFPTAAEEEAARAKAAARRKRSSSRAREREGASRPNHHGLDKADDAAIRAAIAKIRAEKEGRGERCVNPAVPAGVPVVHVKQLMRDFTQTGRADP